MPVQRCIYLTMNDPSFVTAQSQYEVVKGLKKSDIEQLQEWLKRQPHLPPIPGMYYLYILKI